MDELRIFVSDHRVPISNRCNKYAIYQRLFIKTQFKLNVLRNHEASRNANSQAANINDGVQPIGEEVSENNFEIIVACLFSLKVFGIPVELTTNNY
jgi:hypothetical protein